MKNIVLKFQLLFTENVGNFVSVMINLFSDIIVAPILGMITNPLNKFNVLT